MPLNDEEGVPPAADDEGIAGELARCCRELDAADAAHTCMLARYESFDTGNRGYLLPTDVGAVLEALGYDGHDDEAYISSLFTCFAAYGGSDDTQLDVEGFEQMWDHLGGEERAVAVEAWAASVAGASVLRKMGSAAATLLDVSTGGAAGQLVRVVSAKQSPTARAKRQVEVRRKVRVGAAAAGALGADLERRRAAAAADAEVETEAERLRVIAEAKAAAAERANRHRRLADYERRKQLRTRRGQFGPQIWFVLLKTIPASLIVSYLFITTVADIRQADTATCLVNGANSTGLLAGMADRVEDEEWGDCQPQDLSCLQNEMVAEVAEDWTDLMHYMEVGVSLRHIYRHSQPYSRHWHWHLLTSTHTRQQ
jgi:hypothetical protein